MIGKADNAKDMITKLADYLVVEPYDGGYNLAEVLEDMNKYFDDVPSLEEAKEIARSARKENGNE